MNYLEKLQQFDTAEISDALDSCGIEGALLGIKPIVTGLKIVAPIFTVKYLPYEKTSNHEFKSAGNYIDDVPEGSVILIDNNASSDCTTWGDILTQVAIMKNIKGTIVNGAVRDVEFVRKINYPLFSTSIYMRSGKNRVYKANQQCVLNINNVLINPGDIAIADDNGVVIVPLNMADEIIAKAENIRLTEKDIIESVKAGLSLEAARKKHRYDQPWLKAGEK